MKAFALLFALSTLSVQAQTYFHTRIGNFDYWHGSDGYSGYGQSIGNQYYFHDNYGSGSGTRIGNQDYFQYFPYSTNNDEDQGN
jgi:hypothetical protein